MATGSLFGEIATLLAIVGSGVAVLAKAFRFVHEGELGIKLRFGKALRNKDGTPRIIHPGFVMLIPFAESLRAHHVRQQTINFPNQKIMIRGGLTFEISAIIILRVTDIYKALFEVDNLEDSLANLGMKTLRKELSERDLENISNTDEISEKLLATIKPKADEWGAELILFALTDISPTSDSGPLINVIVGAKLKVAALKEAAKELGCDVHTLNTSLGAILVGMPLTATTNLQVGTSTHQGEENNSVMAKLEKMSDALEKITQKIT